MSTQSYKVADKLFLVRQSVSKAAAPAKSVEVPTNHLVVIDCSGSMSGDLPQIREQLKKKLPKLIGDKDTLSIIWFSGRGQFGTLIEAEPVSTLADLNDVNKAIDRWLRPVGLTGFKEPLEEATKLIERVSKKRPGSAFSLFFMSDGCDNQWSRPDILKAVEKAAGGFSASTFVEYGYYADRPLLTAMAEKAGGQLIFSEAFDKYQPLFEAAMAKRPTGAPRIEVKIPGDPLGGFVWTQAEGDLTTYGIEGAAIKVPEDTTEVWFLSPSVIGDVSGPNGPTDLGIVAELMSKKTSEHAGFNAAYAAMSLFSVRMKPEIIFPLLKATGDVKFIEQFSSCFGKQKYSAFMDDTKAAVFDSSKRLTEGFNPNKVPRDDAFTVLDMLRLLASDDENRVLFDHSAFKYNRISRSRVDANTVLIKDELAEVEKLTTEMAKLKDVKKIQEITAKITAITNKPEPLKFEATPAPDGYAVSNLTYKEENPNISILIRREGTVDISKHAPDAVKSKLPAKFPSFIFRNYAIVKDGLINVKTLPVKLSQKTIATLFAEAKAGRIPDDIITVDQDNEEVTLLHFDALPIINRKMVKAVSAKTIFENEWALLKVQAAQKVYKSTLSEIAGTRKSPGFEEKYGKDVADWLKDAGFTDYSGFGPKMVQGEAQDFYMAKELKVSIKSFSSIPSLNEFKKQAAKGKFTPSASIMSEAFKATEDFLATEDGKDKAKAEVWLKAEEEKLDIQRRTMIADKAQQVFSIIVGQVWPVEFKSIDENEMTIKADGLDLACKVEMKEVEVKL